MAARLGKPPMPWQQHVADVALEIDPETGQLYYEEIVITVPRQSGKTTLILALMVWRCVIMARRLMAQTITYIAQSGKMSRKKLEREFIPILRAGRGFNEVEHSRARPIAPTDFKPSMNNGSEHVLFGTGSYLQIEAPTSTGSHGDVLDMSIIDEAFARQDDLVEQAVDAASVTRESPQAYIISTAGNAKSLFLWRKVQAGRKAVESGNDSRTAYFEWSVPDSERWDDSEAWAKYLPALGHTISLARLVARMEKAKRTVDDDAEIDDEGFTAGPEGFRRGYLNQWVHIPSTAAEEVPAKLPAAAWLATAGHTRGDRKVEGLAFDVARDGSWASIAVSAGTQSAPYGEVIEHREGVGWLPSRLAELAAKYRVPVACNGAGTTGGQVGPVQAALSAAGLDPVRQLTSREYQQACAGLFADVIEGRFERPSNQGPLDVAAGKATERALGESWAWDIRSATVPICPLVALTVARALLPTAAADEEFFVY